MRPALKPGLLPVWRNRDTMQIGIDPRRAIALTGMRGAAGLLRLLDGSRDRGQVLTGMRGAAGLPSSKRSSPAAAATGGRFSPPPAIWASTPQRRTRS